MICLALREWLIVMATGTTEILSLHQWDSASQGHFRSLPLLRVGIRVLTGCVWAEEKSHAPHFPSQWLLIFPLSLPQEF
jgi:hypothetical protein